MRAPVNPFMAPPPVVPSAPAIRARMRRGEDTRSIASAAFIPEAAVWNALARDDAQPRELPPVFFGRAAATRPAP